MCILMRMADRDDALMRVDKTGTVHPVGRVASQMLRARAGEWRIQWSPADVIFLRSEKSGHVLRLAGEIRAPGAVCDTISLVAQSNWHGELVVVDESGNRSLYFDQGYLVGAATTVEAERLGEVLYRFGVVTRTQVEQTVKAASASGKRFGEAAMELEFVTRQELFEMIRRQAEEVFFGTMLVSEGMFYFFDRYDESLMLTRHNLSTSALLMEGARRMDEMQYFRDKIPNETYIPVATGKDRKVPEELAEVYAQVDGKRSVAEIGRRIGQLEFEVSQHVFQLINGGFVTMVASRPHGAEAIMAAFNPGLIEIHRRCDEAGKGPELRDGLSRFATGGGVYDPLFMGAGPLHDGTLKPERVAKNLAALAGEDPDAWLMQLLHEYVGFALFHAGSILPREAEPPLVAAVMEILKPVRPTESAGSSAPSALPSMAPPSILDDE
jgi:hypothetical protein